MRIALVYASKAKYYPVSLLKIGAWQKDLGNNCTLYINTLPPAGAADEIWVSTCFTFDIPKAISIIREAKKRAALVKVGGVSSTLLPQYFEDEGIAVHYGLLPEAEEYPPDYSLLGHKPEYSISHTSRGCVRHCGFCVVSKVEPKFTDRPNWAQDLHPDTTKVLFYDNNWLAKPKKAWYRDVAMLHDLVKSRRVRSIDFNQGLDARLMTEAKADALKGLPFHPMRFAFDGMHEDGPFQKAIEIMAVRGFRDFIIYGLYNYKDTPKDFYYRLSECARLSQELGVLVPIFPMRFQPILKIDSHRKYVGEHWTLKERTGFMNLIASVSPFGGIYCRTTQSFKYWFGDNADQFKKMLNYPNLKELIAKRKGYARRLRYEN